MGDVLANVRKSLNKGGVSEIQLHHKHEDLRELWEERQGLLSEMNVAKRKAAEQAAQPYLEKLQEIEQNYATILSLIPKE